MLAPSNPLRRDTQERDAARGRYSHISTDAFSDDFYNHGGASRHASRWGVLAAAPVGLYKASVTRFGRRRGPAMLGVCCMVLVLTALAFHGRFVSAKRSWPLLGATSSVVFPKEQLRKIWEWEIMSGHYPSTRASEWDASDYAVLLVLIKYSCNCLQSQPRSGSRQRRTTLLCRRARRSNTPQPRTGVS